MQEAFRTTPGVVGTRVGYAGGTTEHPTYEQVCSGHTEHAEVVEVTFDPALVTYERLFQIFFENHNPTCLNYQGPDFGSQYRSVIFTSSDQQHILAVKEIQKQQKNADWGGRQIVTQVLPAPTFYPAEEYHQQYLMKRGKGSCHL